MLTGLENVVCGRKKSSCSLSVAEVDRHIEQLTTASEHCDLAIKVTVILGCKCGVFIACVTSVNIL